MFVSKTKCRVFVCQNLKEIEMTKSLSERINSSLTKQEAPRRISKMTTSSRQQP